MISGLINDKAICRSTSATPGLLIRCGVYIMRMGFLAYVFEFTGPFFLGETGNLP